MKYEVVKSRAQLVILDARGYTVCIVPFSDAEGQATAKRICALLNADVHVAGDCNEHN